MYMTTVSAALTKYDEMVAATDGPMDDESRLLKQKELIRKELLDEVRKRLSQLSAINEN
jgi:hypothetical protein